MGNMMQRCFLHLNQEAYFYMNAMIIKNSPWYMMSKVTKLKTLCSIAVKAMLHRNQSSRLPAIGTVNPNVLIGLKKPYRQGNDLLEYSKVYFDMSHVEESAYQRQLIHVCHINEIEVVPAHKKMGKLEPDALLVTSNFSLYKKYYSKSNVLFFFDARWVMKQQNVPSLSEQYEETFQNIVGQGLYDGQRNHNLLYTHCLITLAPCVYHFLEALRDQALLENKKVLFLCEVEDEVARLYGRMFGDCYCFDWRELEKQDTEAVRNYLNNLPHEGDYLVVNPYGGVTCPQMLIDLWRDFNQGGQLSRISLAEYVGQSLNQEMIWYLMGDRPVMTGITKTGFEYKMPKSMPKWQNHVAAQAIYDYGKAYQEGGRGTNGDRYYNSPKKSDLKKLLAFSEITWKIIQKEDSL